MSVRPFGSDDAANLLSDAGSHLKNVAWLAPEKDK